MTKYSVSLQKSAVVAGFYEVIKEVGAGGYGAVYSAIDTKSRCQVAIKIDLDPKTNQLKNEADIYNHIKHLIRKRPNKSPIIEFLQGGYDCNFKVNYIVFSFCGPDLRTLKKKTPYDRFTMYTSLWITERIVEIFEFLHCKCQLIHRDVKPANFVISAGPNGLRDLRVIDFGLTQKAVNGKARNLFRGTLRYSSINVIDNDYIYHADDLWSLYYMTVENINGQLLWRRATKNAEVNTFKQIVYNEDYRDPNKHLFWFGERQEPKSLITMRLDLVKGTRVDFSRYAVYTKQLREDLSGLSRNCPNLKLDWELKLENN